METLDIKSDEIRYDKKVNLLGSDFIFFFSWNGRESYRYLTVSDIDGNLIRGLVGIKVVANWQLNRMVKEDTFPAGVLMAINKTDTDPGLDDLKLVFIPEDEIDA